MTDVHGVLVTHMHWDHLGLADRIRQASGAWVALHEDDIALISQPSYRDAGLAVESDRQNLLWLGAPPDAQRVSLLVDGSALATGRAVWLRRGWPQLWGQLVEVLPRLQEFA